MERNKLLVGLIALLVLADVVSAAVTVTNLVVDDSDGVLTYGTTYLFNATGSVDNESKNITSCTINGVSMTGPGGNGSGTWNYSGTVNSFNPAMSDNCTYTQVNVSCVLADGSVITTANNSWTALPCIESSSAYSELSDITGASTYLLYDQTDAIHLLVTEVNNTPVNASTATKCVVTCRADDDTNVTLWMPEVTYNASYSYCPYDCMDQDSDTIKVVSAGQSYLKGTKPEAVFGANLVVTFVIGLGVTAAAAYGIGKRRGRGVLSSWRALSPGWMLLSRSGMSICGFSVWRGWRLRWLRRSSWGGC